MFWVWQWDIQWEAVLGGDGSTFVMFLQKRKIPCYKTEGAGGGVFPWGGSLPSVQGSLQGLHTHPNLCPRQRRLAPADTDH